MDHPEQFPLATAREYLAGIERDRVVRPDVSRQVPVPSARLRGHVTQSRSGNRHRTPLSSWGPIPTTRLRNSLRPFLAPVSGVITDQEITNSSGVQALTAPNPFTISDVSHVWIVCDVYENDLAQLSAVVGVEPPNAKRASASTKFGKSSNTHLFFSVR